MNKITLKSFSSPLFLSIRNDRPLNRSLSKWLALALCLMLGLAGLTSLSEVSARTAPARPAIEMAATSQLSDLMLQQIRVFMQEKESRTPAQRKIDSQLLHASRMRRGIAVAKGIAALRTTVRVNSSGKVLVDIKADEDTLLVRELKSLGSEIESEVNGRIRARVPLERVEEIAALPQIISIRNASQFMTLSSHKNVSQPKTSSQPRLNASLYDPTDGVNTSEGDIAHRAAEARDDYGYDGTGVKIGVLSDGVDVLANLQASGDLPPNVTVLPGQAGTGSEGCAMMEIIHDLAPGAELFFATAIGGFATFSKNIRDLRMVHHCDILVDDVLYLGESVFQDGQSGTVSSPLDLGMISQAVSDVTKDGALYFTAAGNTGNKTSNTASTWEGDFLAANPAPPPFLLDFGGGAFFDTVLGADSLVFLQWSDPLGTSSNDYDLFIFSGFLPIIVAASNSIQNGNDDPIEAAPALAGNRIVIATKTSPPVRFLSLHLFGGRIPITTEGAIFGHGALESVMSVGAVSARTAKGDGGIFSGAESVETYSSDGNRRVFYKADGAQITPNNFTSTGGTLRQKPDISAADDVATAAGDIFNPFRGTSAAAPHAAGIAAILLSAKSSLTPAQVRSALTQSALNLGVAGTDRDSGAGIAMAVPALQAIGAKPLPKISDISISDKKLLVNGKNFSDKAKILVDGTEQKTKNDAANPASMLIAKKAGKKISPGQTVTVVVRNNDGRTSAGSQFTRAN